MLTLRAPLRGGWPLSFGGNIKGGLRNRVNDHVLLIGIRVILTVIFFFLTGCTSQTPEGIHHGVVVVVHRPGKGRVLVMEPKLFYRHFLHWCESYLVGAALLCKTALVEHGLPLHSEIGRVLAAIHAHHAAGAAFGAYQLLGVSEDLQVLIIRSHV